jgi:hypothetical protein
MPPQSAREREFLLFLSILVNLRGYYAISAGKIAKLPGGIADIHGHCVDKSWMQMGSVGVNGDLPGVDAHRR